MACPINVTAWSARTGYVQRSWCYWKRSAPMGGDAQRRTQASNAARSVWSVQKSERSIVAPKRLTTAERRGRTWSTRTAQRRAGDDSCGITHTDNSPVAATDAQPQGEGESSLAGMV